MEHALTLQDAVGSDPFGNVDQVAYMDNGDARPLDLFGHHCTAASGGTSRTGEDNGIYPILLQQFGNAPAEFLTVFQSGHDPGRGIEPVGQFSDDAFLFQIPHGIHSRFGSAST